MNHVVFRIFVFPFAFFLKIESESNRRETLTD